MWRPVDNKRPGHSAWRQLLGINQRKQSSQRSVPPDLSLHHPTSHTRLLPTLPQSMIYPSKWRLSNERVVDSKSLWLILHQGNQTLYTCVSAGHSLVWLLERSPRKSSITLEGRGVLTADPFALSFSFD